MLNYNPRSWARSAWLWTRMARRLKNWPDIYAKYLSGQSLPTLQLRNGISLQHGSNDAPVLLLFEVFADGVYRKHLSAARSGTIIDIGANIGATAIDFSFSNPGIKVHSYEPNPSTCQMLRQNILANQLLERVTVFEEAVGRGDGSLRLWANGPSVVATAYGEEPPFPGCQRVEVPVIGLNTCVGRVNDDPVVLLKIDAEGAEADILEGADPALFDRIQNVALEYHSDLCPNADARCETVLRRSGYCCERVPGREAHRGMLYGWRK